MDEALGDGTYAGDADRHRHAEQPRRVGHLNDECMPQLLNGTGAPKWGDVANHPWTTGMQLDYGSGGRPLGAVAAGEPARGQEAVAAVTFNNDFGNAYVEGFETFIEGTDIEVVEQQFHEPTAPDLTNQFTTIAASGADVVLIETSGTFCTQAMAEVEKNTGSTRSSSCRPRAGR